MKVFITLGCPASGKSTYSKNIDAFYISSDEVRARLYDEKIIDELYSKESHSKVFSECRRLIRENLDKDIYFDATNLNRRKRAALYRDIKTWNKDTEVIILVFIVDYNTLAKRDANRKATVGAEYIRQCFKNFQPPRKDVDCDGYKIASKVDYSIFEKEQSVDLAHDSAYHKETVNEHIAMTCENAKHDRQLLEIAKFHDVGKFFCKEMINDEYATFKQHENVSAMYYLSYIDEITEETIENLEVIFQHMQAHKGISDKAIRRNKLTRRELDLIEKFAQIDNESRVL